MNLEPWQWALIVLGAFLVGVSKAGIVGMGVLFVAIFANVLPARQATGFVLPLLIFGDVIAVASYRQHTLWPHLWRLCPSTALGVVLGTLALGRLDDAATSDSRLGEARRSGRRGYPHRLPGSTGPFC